MSEFFTEEHGTQYTHSMVTSAMSPAAIPLNRDTGDGVTYGWFGNGLRCSIVVFLSALANGCSPLDVDRRDFEPQVIATPSTSDLEQAESLVGDQAEQTPEGSIVQSAATVDLFADAPPLSDPIAESVESSPDRLHIRVDAQVPAADTAVTYTMAQIVQRAQSEHPSIRAASREIEVARAGLIAAVTKPNPNLVINFDTPVNDPDAASRLTTRVTVPFGGKTERNSRRQVVLTQIAKAETALQATTKRVKDEVTDTAIKVLYLQQRLAFELQDEQLAGQQLEQLVEAPQRDDPARNILDQIDARTEADRATRQRFTTDRELRVARALLGNQIGDESFVSVIVDGEFDGSSTVLPSLQDVIAIAEPDSAQIAVALAELEESRAIHRLQRNIRTSREFGPKYQDRLGRDDDSIGVRLDMDLDLHHIQAGPITQTAQKSYHQQDRLELARHLWLGEITSLYRELESLLDEAEHYRQDVFIEEQQARMNDPSTLQLLTGSQRLEIERAIVRRQLEELERRYSIAWIRSRIGLDPEIGSPPVTVPESLSREPQPPDPPFHQAEVTDLREP